MLRPFFTRDRISDFENVDRHAMASIALAKERLRAGYPVDIQVCTSSLGLNSWDALIRTLGSCISLHLGHDHRVLIRVRRRVPFRWPAISPLCLYHGQLSASQCRAPNRDLLRSSSILSFGSSFLRSLVATHGNAEGSDIRRHERPHGVY